LTAQYNDMFSVTQLFDCFPDDIAAVIVEPVAANMNCVLPQADFLMQLREICDHHQSLLIFDEVITGFRVGLGGAQALYGVTPDMTTLGKIIGGGLPIGAFGGRKDIMENIAPTGPVYQAGTLSGNPISIAAGLATLDEISKPGFYDKLAQNCAYLAQGLREAARVAKMPLVINQVCGLFGIFFSREEKITHYQQVMGCDIPSFQRFFHQMLHNGIYLAPSAFEAGFISGAHSKGDLDTTIAVAEQIFKKVILNRN
jgi:glutamate-1-semialdehyde 2,1-aminomutase